MSPQNREITRRLERNKNDGLIAPDEMSPLAVVYRESMIEAADGIFGLGTSNMMSHVFMNGGGGGRSDKKKKDTGLQIPLFHRNTGTKRTKKVQKQPEPIFEIRPPPKTRSAPTPTGIFIKEQGDGT